MKYKHDDYGLWIVKGEDPNCDLGGPHIQPLLGYFKGFYKDVENYSKQLDNWKNWGSGGSIEKINIQEITKESIPIRQSLLKEQQELRDRLGQLKEILGE